MYSFVEFGLSVFPFFYVLRLPGVVLKRLPLILCLKILDSYWNSEVIFCTITSLVCSRFSLFVFVVLFVREFVIPPSVFSSCLIHIELPKYRSGKFWRLWLRNRIICWLNRVRTLHASILCCILVILSPSQKCTDQCRLQIFENSAVSTLSLISRPDSVSGHCRKFDVIVVVLYDFVALICVASILILLNELCVYLLGVNTDILC